MTNLEVFRNFVEFHRRRLGRQLTSEEHERVFYVFIAHGELPGLAIKLRIALG